MKIGERMGWTGRFRTRVYRFHCDECAASRFPIHAFPVLVEDEWHTNLIVDTGLDAIRSALASGGVDLGIRYLGVGDSATAPAAGDTTLINETERKAITSQSLSGTTGQIDTTTYLGPNDAVGTIEELGWFAGTGATAAADSGIMVARVLYSKAKTNLEAIQVDREDTFA